MIASNFNTAPLMKAPTGVGDDCHPLSDASECVGPAAEALAVAGLPPLPKGRLKAHTCLHCAMLLLEGGQQFDRAIRFEADFADVVSRTYDYPLSISTMKGRSLVWCSIQCLVRWTADMHDSYGQEVA